MPSPQLFFSPARAAAWAALAAAALAPGRASAVVNQIDGTVVPVLTPASCAGAADKCVQTALNIGEGLPANAQNNPLNAIFDAATTPEVFTIPQTNGVFGQVTFRDLQEGAGYENTFGWYNVNDPTQIYPVILCAEEAGTIKVVDFQQEFLQGRYQGGFIGFFLITPEGTATNCGSLSNVGYLYYTEAARNGDGNYVHYLIYSSEVNPLSYYFAFEDLFRGGDNDFDDMALQVTGLLKPCTPSAEICDGMDNNCDGLIDNMPVDAGGPCGLPDIGVCEDGTLSCQGGSLVCVGAVSPAPEVCDGLDNDCDGMVDDMPVDAGGPCGSDVGECDLGVQTCVGGVLVCVGGGGPSPEVCNTLDDDCDGMVDEDTVDAGGPCGSNVGVCEPGTLTCQGGQIVCVGGTLGTPEVCNNLDDDCNGAIDDGNPGGGGPCGSDVGICSPGVEYCIGGVIVCVGGTPPGEEICDGLDNDCDGVGDEMAPCPGASVCLDGACTAPCSDGEFPCPGGQICVGGYCVPESCDNINCPPGQTCISGLCVDSGAGGGGGQGGSGQGGAGGSGTGGAPTGTGAGGPSDNWGLATGGGGALCAARPGASSAGGGAGLAALALTIALAARRRRSRGKGGAR